MDASDFEVKKAALEMAMRFWDGGSVSPSTMVEDAKVFEAYLKGE